MPLAISGGAESFPAPGSADFPLLLSQRRSRPGQAQHPSITRGSLPQQITTPCLAGWLLSRDPRNSCCARARPSAAACVGQGRGRDKAAGRGPHLSSQKVQGECSGTPPGSGCSAESRRPRGSLVPGGAAAGGSAMFSASQAADSRTREPSSLRAPAPPRLTPRPGRTRPCPSPTKASGARPRAGDPREKGRGTVTRLAPQLEPRADGRSGQMDQCGWSL